MSYHIITPDESEGNARRYTAVGLPPTGHEQRGISGGVIATGYLCGFASLFIFPPALALAGIVIGIVCLVRERLGHGIVVLIVSVTCGLFGMYFGAIVTTQVFNKWFTHPIVQTQTEQQGATQTEQQEVTYTTYTADDFYSMAMFGCRWNGHHYIPLPPALDPSVGYLTPRRTPDMTSLPEDFPVAVTGTTGFFSPLFGSFIRTPAVELPNDLMSRFPGLNTNGHWLIVVHGSFPSSVGCVSGKTDALFYNRDLSYTMTVMVTGRYYKSGHAVLYPCRIEELLDYSGDDISR